MSAERVDSVITSVARHDPGLARLMQVAADGLTAGDGEERITQASLQQYLWYDLPRRSPDDTWRPVVEAAAVLLSLLGLDRYAAIARSATTTAVLDAWGEAPGKGFAAFTAARSSSGVEPPDTGLLVWGEVFGLEEAWARYAVEAALEEAIVAGRLRPGVGSWRKVACTVCEEALLARADDGGAVRLAAVLGERADSWVAQARPAELKAWRTAARAGMDLLEPVPVEPADAAASGAAIRWLLERCQQGVQLTQARYLPPALVQEAAGRFDWWPFDGQPRSEADVHQLGALRETANRLHLIGRRARRLATTRRGLLLAADPTVLFHEVAATLARESAYLAMLSEIVAHLLLAGPAVGRALEEAAGAIVAAQGWMAGREPVGAERAGWDAHRALYHWRLFNLVDEVPPRWEGGQQVEPGTTALTPAGRAAARILLRARATAPGRRLDLGLE